MKTTRTITAAIAALIASASIFSTVGAATYYSYDGRVFSDGINDGREFQEDKNGVYQETVYIGNDAYYGKIYYSTEIGYYAYNGGSNYQPLGWDFTMTEYIGKDIHGRKIYFSDDLGYFYLKGDNYYVVDINTIVF